MAKNNIEIKTNFGNIILTDNNPAKTSLLGDLIVEFSGLASELDFEDSDVAVPFEIEDKITHNSVVKYLFLFENYISNEALLRRVYSIVHETKPLARAMILRLVNQEYRKWKGHLLRETSDVAKTEIEHIREKSDFLIEKVLMDVKQRLIGIVSITNVEEEFINECICIVIADAFFECKILENPNT
ncbi:MAG: hypothetical protein K0S23_1230 [Fluviicola sp.]|uniref:hypothetical protein n=1 Tax=Fluviicola sp. TaxID=1917219 RepID=UPI00260C349F|nr:hypothetical protein [Fluviicola sp.]MDF3026923.1 hypothetical protein [Fluviicola sp.]